MTFHDIFIKVHRLYLGSRSPRRKQLLADLRLPFEVWVKEDNPEIYSDEMSQKEVAEFLAKEKSKPYLGELKAGDILITADTIVCYRDHILGKPETREEAIDSLKQLSGNQHQVITGVCISSPDKNYCFSSETLVKFADLTEAEILYYIDNFAPFDKAGAYGIQEWIGYIGVERIEGSYFNVMGLPVQKLYTELKKFTGLDSH